MSKTEILKEQPTPIHTMNARNGKIARLPRSIRNQLNERLDCSEESPQLLQWLNALPEVQEVVKDHFAGVPISKQNLSEWRQGGFEEWRARLDLCEDALEVRQLSERMDDEDSTMVLADDVAQVLAARFGSLIANWNGEVDEKFEARSRVLNRLCRSVVQLQRGMHRSHQEAFEMDRKLEEQERVEKEEIREKLTAPLFDLLEVQPLAESFGGGEIGRKIAKYILAVRKDNLDNLDNLQTKLADLDDELDKAQPKPKESKPVKPAQKRRTVKRLRKTKPETVPNPLPQSDIEAEAMEESSQVESKSVKVGQTDLAPDAASFPDLNPNPNPNLNPPPPPADFPPHGVATWDNPAVE
jgi:hypothetical protein